MRVVTFLRAGLLDSCLIQVVGHNMFLDLGHLYEAFIEPLPDSYFDFKRKFGKLFPKVYDTKFVCTSLSLDSAFPSSSLGDAYATVTKSTGNSRAADCFVCVDLFLDIDVTNSLLTF